MIGGILEIAEDDRHLSLHRGFAKVSDAEKELGRVPLDLITTVLLTARQITLSKSILSALMERGVAVVCCGGNWHPDGMMLPYSGHHKQAGTLFDQIGLSEPRRKRLWQQVVRAKVRNQRRMLERHAAPPGKIQELTLLESRVRSGDPDNIEAQAARHYWPTLMGNDFRRDIDAPGINGCLNYGYAVVRAATARAVVGAGLTAALGLHHRSRINSFALVDDLMEPFRPLVDGIVREMYGEGLINLGLTVEGKRRLVAVLQRDLPGETGMSPLINCLHTLARSYVASLTEKEAALIIPELPSPGLLL